jgi:hypothetical protein
VTPRSPSGEGLPKRFQATTTRSHSAGNRILPVCPARDVHQECCGCLPRHLIHVVVSCATYNIQESLARKKDQQDVTKSSYCTDSLLLHLPNKQCKERCALIDPRTRAALPLAHNAAGRPKLLSLRDGLEIGCTQLVQVVKTKAKQVQAQWAPSQLTTVTLLKGLASTTGGTHSSTGSVSPSCSRQGHT